MKRPRASCTATLDDLLRVTLRAARATVFADRVALYIAALTDPAGFALAAAVRARIDGADPDVLLERALAAGVRAPLMIGAAPVEMLARIVETLPDLNRGERRGAAQLLRGIHARASVPVLIVDDGSAAASALEMPEAPDEENDDRTGRWGWERPGVAEA